MLNNFTVFLISNTNIKGCKVNVDYFKKLTNRRFGPYCMSNLKQAYAKLTGINLNKKINFYISNGIIILVPESGKGFDFDWSLINNALKMNEGSLM